MDPEGPFWSGHAFPGLSCPQILITTSGILPTLLSGGHLWAKGDCGIVSVHIFGSTPCGLIHLQMYPPIQAVQIRGDVPKLGDTSGSTRVCVPVRADGEA